MTRFELIEGTSAKFWSIERSGKLVVTAWGRIGTEGQTKTTSFSSVAEAEKKESQLVAEKTRKGYCPVLGTSAAQKTKTVPAMPVPGSLTAVPEKPQQKAEKVLSEPSTKSTVKAIKTSKVAQKSRIGIFPIAFALSQKLENDQRLVLIRAGNRSAKFCEYEINSLSMQFTVREGDVGSPGRITKKVKMSPRGIGIGYIEREISAWTAWAIDNAKLRMTKGYVAQDVSIKSAVLEAWLAHVATLAPLKKGWQGDSERDFMEWRNSP